MRQFFEILKKIYAYQSEYRYEQEYDLRFLIYLPKAIIGEAKRDQSFKSMSASWIQTKIHFMQSYFSFSYYGQN